MPGKVNRTINGFDRGTRLVTPNTAKIYYQVGIEVPEKRLLVVRCATDDALTIVRQSQPLDEFPAPNDLRAFTAHTYEEMDRIASVTEEEPFVVPDHLDHQSRLVEMVVRHEVLFINYEGPGQNQLN